MNKFNDFLGMVWMVWMVVFAGLMAAVFVLTVKLRPCNKKILQIGLSFGAQNRVI